MVKLLKKAVCILLCLTISISIGGCSDIQSSKELNIKVPLASISVDTNYGNSDAWDMSKNDFSKAETFEGASIPNQWRVLDGGNISLSKNHFKNGIQSLQWTWGNSSKLRVDEPKYLESAGKNKDGGIKGWIYSEKPINDKITFSFGSKSDIESGEPRYTFDFNMNFKGWRAFSINFKQDAANEKYKGNGQEPLKVMVITSPNNTASNGVFLDLIEFIDKAPWNRTPDYQMPKTRTTLNDGKGGSWDRSLYYSLKKPEIKEESSLTAEEQKAFDAIAKRYEEWVFGKNLDLTKEQMKIRNDSLNSYIQFGLDKYEKLNIKRNEDGSVTGIPLFSSRSTYGPKFGNDVATKIFMPLVFDYKLNGNEKSKEKLMNLFDYFNDQGWADGSGLETLDHETNRSSGYFHAVYLMRNELKASGRLERELATMNWYTNFGKTFGEDYTESTADDVRTHFMYKLLYVMTMDDSPKKAQYMKGLLKWMNSAISIAPGYSSTIKPDYMGFHHRGVYSNAYTPQAYNLAAVVTYLLHDTAFSLSNDSYNNLKNALLTQRIISNKYDVPIGVSGRFPSNNTITNEVIPAYAYMAMSKSPIDKEMAEAFMSLWNPNSSYLKNGLFPRVGSDIVYYDTLGGLQLMMDLASKDFKAAKEPEGFWMKPYAALAIHRRDNWMVATKGWSQYSWDYEAGANENTYGRYIGYGSVQILGNGNPVSTISSGYNVKEGWDWNRWPGTTTINLPLDKLAFNAQKDNHRDFTDETFVGGVSNHGENGLFSMKLHDTVYNKSFRANKSVFYFGNEIICLGSDIVNDDSKNSTETTIFQSYMQSNLMPFWLQSSKEIVEVPFSKKFDTKEKAWMLDPYGNGYIIPNANGLRIERGMQNSMDQTGRKKTSGLYTTAWIDHGKAPKDAGYEYAILVQSNPELVKKYADSPKYKVLQKDKYAHIVEHSKLNTIGYAIFDEKVDIKFGPLKKVSAPVMVMAKTEGNIFGFKKEITLSVSDPDLRLAKMPDMRMDEDTVWSKSEMKKVTVSLEGKWNLVETKENARVIGIEGETTILEFDCTDGKTIELKLAQK